MNRSDLILAIDQGTTGSKALLVDSSLRVVAEKTVDFPQFYPKPGWVEHDLEKIWQSVQKALSFVLRKRGRRKIACIGITNQRETICFWDRKTGKPLSRAIVWQDRRTADFCEELRAAGAEPKFQQATGLLLDPYFSGTKVAWALKNWPELAKADRAGRLAIGTIDSYLMARLSGGKAHVTEPSNASRTLAFHLTEHRWDEGLCSTLGVPMHLWPEVRPSVGQFATVKGVRGLVDGTPITGVLGDQQAALLGQACIRPGQAKCTYGTGAFILMNTGTKPVFSKHRLLTTIAWSLSEADCVYALEGSAFIAGAAVQWVRDGMGLIKKSSEIEGLARKVDSSEGVVFVPSLTGLGAPHWDPHATGLLTGITRGTTRAHVARAVLEGVALQNAEILTAMEADLGNKLVGLNVDGGASTNNLLMQMQADVLGVELTRPKLRETTSLGAVFAAGLGAGIWTSMSDIQKTWKVDRRFKPFLSDAERAEFLARWRVAVARAKLH